ncbi:MAG: 3-phosphoshikimate 1-carboxyvinyltransferase [Pyrinomonadaceae bacterium]
MRVRPAKSLRGEVAVPGDKSVSHRAAMFSAIAEGETVISNFSASEDCSSTLACLAELGVEIEREGPTVRVRGRGLRGLRQPAKALDCGNSGTTMRLLSGILAGQTLTAELVGDRSLSSRPMRRVIEPLKAMGAEITSADGHAPLKIEGRDLSGIDYRLPVASAQIKSCVLLAGLNASGRTTVVEPVATRDHTERMLAWLGADISTVSVGSGERSVTVRGGQTLTARDIAVPGDISAAAFFAVAAAALEGSEIVIPGVGINETRTGVLTALRSIGVNLEIANARQVSNEPVGDLVVRGGIAASVELDGPVKIDGAIVANLIDEVPIIAVLGTQLPSGLEIRDAAELRVKESDRIATVVQNLRRMGASVEEFHDGLRVERSTLHAAEIESYGDHRIAMAFAVAALLASDGETAINGAEAVDVSFPGFFEMLASVTLAR